MADPNVTDSFIREVDEELRQEQMAKLWKQYGNYVIGACVAIVLVVAGREGWQFYDRSQREAFGERYHQAAQLIVQGDRAAAGNAFLRLAQDAGGGQSLLAALRAAALKAEAGDKDGAAAAFFRIADDSGHDRPYRDLATILGAVNALDGQAAGLDSRLAPLMAAGNPWRHSAREIAALAAARTGDAAKARELLETLSNDATAPQSVRTRAGELLKSLAG